MAPSPSNRRCCTPSAKGRAGKAERRTDESWNRPARSSSISLAVDQRKEFVPGLLIVPEGSQHRTGYGRRVLFFHAAHHHAEMPRFDDHADSTRLNRLLNCVRDLVRQPLLNLKAAGEHIYQTRNFA